MRKLTFLLACLFLVGVGLVHAQSRSISGKVLSDEDGQPIIGATILVKGTATGSITGNDGEFRVTMIGNAKNLVISYVGMKTSEVVAVNNMVVRLKSDELLIDEVVVTAMGITREKKSLGYSSTSLSADEIARSKAVNPISALQGRVAGVDISSSPGPGATQNVIIRGASSFGNNQPLYIVDGVPLTNSQNRSGDDLNSQVDFGSGINALNPDDIADLTVLKGAAATALYGSRAANGVIMITSKSGKNTDGKIQIAYDGGVSVSRVGFLPTEQTQFGQGWSGDRALGENGSWGAAFDGKDRVWGNIVDNSQKIKPYSYLNNRIRDFYDLGLSYKNSLSMTGGNAKTNYFVSLSQNNVDGVIPTDQDSYNRYTVSTRGSHQTGKLKVSTSINFSTEKNRAVASGQGTSMLRSLYEIANDISIVDLKDYNNKFNNLDNYFTPYGLNPYYVLAKNGAEQTKNKLFGKFQLDYDILKNLKLTYRFGGDFETAISETHTAIVAFSDGSPNFGQSTANPGSYEEKRTERIQMNHDLFANYNARFLEDFSVNAIVGLNANERTYNWLSGSITSIDIPEYYNLINSLTPSVSEQHSEQRRLVGTYANVDFGFKDYAYLTLTARNDWSSTLPKDKNSFFYPGATFSFLVTDFLKAQGVNTDIVNFAKFRTAYGMTGNDADVYYIYNRYVAASSANPGYPSVDDLKFPLDGVNSYTVSNRLGNADLKPEITSEFEIGAEVKFFNSRLGFDFSYYNRLTEGLIEVLPKDPSSGYTEQISNLGDVRNKGIELVVDFVPVKTKDFTWGVSWNYAVNNNVVEKLDVPEVLISGFSTGGIYAVEGKAMGQFKFPTSKKVILEGKEYTVVDGKGNPQATTDKEYIGEDINEKFRMGFTNTFTWKGVSLSGTLDFRYGGSIYSYTKDYMNWVGSAPETVMNDRNPFIIPNSVVDNGDGTYSENTVAVDPTALHTFYSLGGTEGESYAVIDRSYLKLRDLSLSYMLPAKMCSKIGISSLRLSLNASNILLWTPVENQYIDPETTTFGNDIGAKFGEFAANPSNEIYTFGLSLSF